MLGHEPLPGGTLGSRVDIVVVEPAWPRAMVAAKALRESDPDLPIVFVSTLHPNPSRRRSIPSRT